MLQNATDRIALWQPAIPSLHCAVPHQASTSAPPLHQPRSGRTTLCNTVITAGSTDARCLLVSALFNCEHSRLPLTHHRFTLTTSFLHQFTCALDSFSPSSQWCSPPISAE